MFASLFTNLNFINEDFPYVSSCFQSRRLLQICYIWERDKEYVNSNWFLPLTCWQPSRVQLLLTFPRMILSIINKEQVYMYSQTCAESFPTYNKSAADDFESKHERVWKPPLNESTIIEKSWKHGVKRKNCSFWAISSFVNMFSKSSLLQRHQKASIWGKGLRPPL